MFEAKEHRCIFPFTPVRNQTQGTFYDIFKMKLHFMQFNNVLIMFYIALKSGLLIRRVKRERGRGGTETHRDT